ncbi:MAG: DUF4331 domain-containing protein [Acidobacteria bacterium]|nr:DUF4331 domain-containing protein [Acidobacteriota bacterium]
MLPLVALVLLATAGDTFASNHREAPLTALDTKADITDLYAFVSYDDPSKLTLILDVDPFLEPSNGPNFFPFDPEIEYAIHVDNDHDAVEDVSFTFRFETENRLPGVFTGFVGAGGGIAAPANSPAGVPPGTPLIPPAITALDGPGSEGLGIRQHYSVTMVRGFGPRATSTPLAGGRVLFAAPSNAGPRTMPDYASLADQAVYTLDQGIKVFAGTVEDPFFIDLGAAFDSVNLRTDAFETGVPGVLSDSQDVADGVNYAPDDVAGFNVNAIAIEVPISMLTADGQQHDPSHPDATIGVWGTTARPRVKILRDPRLDPVLASQLVQIQRVGNPLINELIIGTGSKDLFSRSYPRNDRRFADFALDPLLARVLNAAYDATVAPGVLPVPDPPRVDLLPLVQYLPPIAAPGTSPGPVADLLRLNTGIPPTPAAQRSRLGFLTLLDDEPANDDAAGFPNGRRLTDDVVDIALRAVVGVLAGPDYNRFPHNRVGDGVNRNDQPLRETFPYLGYAHSARDSRHVDPGETGCTGTCP